MREDDRWRCLGDVFALVVASTEERRAAEERQEIVGREEHLQPSRLVRLFESRDAGDISRQGLERGELFPEVVELGNRAPVPLRSRAARGAGVDSESDQALWLRVPKRSQQDGSQDDEHRGAGADRQTQGQHDGGRRPRASQRAANPFTGFEHRPLNRCTETRGGLDASGVGSHRLRDPGEVAHPDSQACPPVPEVREERTATLASRAMVFAQVAPDRLVYETFGQQPTEQIFGQARGLGAGVHESNTSSRPLQRETSAARDAFRAPSPEGVTR